jgi:hypothetical protein
MDVGVQEIDDLKGQNPELLYHLSNINAGVKQDRCLLYVYRCAVYFAETDESEREPLKLKWWNWKDHR